SVVTSVIWDSMRKVLYIQSEKTPGEAYFWYGPIGMTPKYVYIDGTLFSDVGYAVDTTRQVIKLTVGGGSLLFDFEGKTQPTTAVDIQSMIQQMYAMLSTLSIRQPTAPTVTVPIIDLSWLIQIYVAIANYIDKYSPIKSSLLFPLMLFIVIFTGSYSLLRRGWKQTQLQRGEVVVVRERKSKTSFIQWVVYTLATTAITTPILYYVLPTAFPKAFERPAVDFRLFLFAILASTALALVIVAIIMFQNKVERGYWKGGE
ncbi:MAG: hypothetical protein QXQ33_00565, partial [Nitrososphaerota archaeon]